MNFFDIVFTVLLIGYVLHSLLLGTAKTILTTLGLLGGFLAAENGFANHSSFAMRYTNDINLAETLTYIGIFIFVALLGKLFSIIVTILFSVNRPSWSSRLLGGILGSVKGLCWCLVVMFVVYALVPSFVDDLNRSLYTPWFLELKQLLSGIKFA